MESYIIEDIIRLTGDAKSRAFWEKAVRILGENIVAEEFSELKYQMQTKNVHEPRKYLTALLNTDFRRALILTSSKLVRTSTET